MTGSDWAAQTVPMKSSNTAHRQNRLRIERTGIPPDTSLKLLPTGPEKEAINFHNFQGNANYFGNCST
jgi:hypothetical protein